MKNKVLDRVYAAHSKEKEKLMFLKDFILRQDRSNFYEDLNDTLDFFYKHIPLHFAYEEVVVKALLNARNLSKDEIACLNKVLEDHGSLKSNFEKIKEKAAKIQKVKNNELKEEFMEIVNDTISALIKHAEFEDERLYPLAEKKVDFDLLSIIEQKMSQIVS